jgi:alpha-L-arabinofuranosidase
MGARQVPVSNPVPELNVLALAGQARLPGLSASASIRGRRLAVTLTNPSLDGELSMRIRLAGGPRATEARGLLLTHSDMRATNTSSHPDEIKPATQPVKVVGDTLELSLPRQAVILVECDLNLTGGGDVTRDPAASCPVPRRLLPATGQVAAVTAPHKLLSIAITGS